MAKLEKDRNTPSREGARFAFPAGAQIFAGSLVSFNAEGKLVPSAANGKTCVGVADHAAKAGDTVRVLRGVFALDAAAGAFSLADVGSECAVVDDHTVGKKADNAAAPVAGMVMDVDKQGVWVRI